jgi:hypothetical protein
MPWVRFIRDFDWHPRKLNRRSNVSFKAGMRLMVTREAADDAIAVGAATSDSRKSETSDEVRAKDHPSG